MEDVKPPPNGDAEGAALQPTAENTGSHSDAAPPPVVDIRPPDPVPPPAEKPKPKLAQPPKPKHSSSVPVVPIFLAIVIAGALIAVAIYLALKDQA